MSKVIKILLPIILALAVVIVVLVVLKKDKVKVENPLPAEDTLEVKGKSAVFFMFSEEELDEMKEELGEDFLTAADDAGFYRAESYAYLQGEGVEIFSTENRYALFKKDNGEEVTIDKKAIDANWNVVLFDGKQDPKTVPVIEIQKEGSAYFKSTTDAALISDPQWDLTKKEDCGLTLSNVKANNTVIFPLHIKGSVAINNPECRWSIFEGYAGHVHVIDSNGQDITGEGHLGYDGNDLFGPQVTSITTEGTIHLSKIPINPKVTLRFADDSQRDDAPPYRFSFPVIIDLEKTSL